MGVPANSKLSRALRSGWMSVAARTLLATMAWMGTASVAGAAPPNTMPIWRLQVRFFTLNIEDAETDDSVMVELNGANRTWLDSGRDDHERPSNETFDLRTEGINTLADIDFFRVEKTGSDGWALYEMQLLVNGAVIYIERFSLSSPLWLDNEDGHARVFLNDDYFMRQRSQWINYTVPVRPDVVPVRDMERRIEALTGDFVHGASGTNFIGGDHGVEMFTTSTDTWRVDLDLEDEKQWPYPDLEFDVDFDLTVACASGRPRFTVSNVNTDASWPEDDGGSVNFAASQLAPRLNDMMKNYTFLPCPSIVLSSAGDLHFNRRLPPFVLGEFELTDSVAPIGLHVNTGGEIKPEGKNTFVATVKSTMKTDEKAEFSFELPPQAVLLDRVIGVQRGAESYRIAVKPEQRKDGSSRIAFSDVLRAGSLARYILPILYKSDKGSKGQIKTVIQPLDERTAARVTALEAVTWYEFHPDRVVALVTSIAQSRYVDDEPEQPLK
jgi:hypothetical protein